MSCGNTDIIMKKVRCPHGVDCPLLLKDRGYDWLYPVMAGCVTYVIYVLQISLTNTEHLVWHKSYCGS